MNFFVVSPPGVLEPFPVSYVTSFHLRVDEAPLMDQLVKRFPNFVVIDVAALLEQIQRMMDQVVKAVEFVFCSGFSPAWWSCSRRSALRMTSVCSTRRSCARLGDLEASPGDAGGRVRRHWCFGWSAGVARCHCPRLRTSHQGTQSPTRSIRWSGWWVFSAAWRACLPPGC